MKDPDNIEDKFWNPFSEEIEIITRNERDKFHKELNEYELWSLNNIKNRNQIDGIIIQLSFWSQCRLVYDIIQIPIINGLPFGKDINVQEINFFGE